MRKGITTMVIFLISWVTYAQNINLSNFVDTDGKAKVLLPEDIQKINKLKGIEFYTPTALLYQPTYIVMDKNTVRETYTYNNKGQLTTRIKEQLENGNWRVIEEQAFTYNELGLLVEMTLKTINTSTNTLEFNSKQFIVYNSMKKEETVTYFSYNLNTASWVNQSKFAYEYFNDGSLNVFSLYLWDGVNWRHQMRYTYTYTGNLVSTILIEQHNYTTNTLQNSNFITRTYNNVNNIISSLTKQWMFTGWVNSSLELYEYNSLNLITLSTSSQWSNNDWMFIQKNYYTYEGDKMLSAYTEYIDFTSNTLKPYSKDLFYYGSSPYLLSHEFQFYNQDSSKLLSVYKETFTRDNFGNPLTHIREDWKNNSWTNISKIVYEYDIYGNATSALGYDWDNGSNNWIVAPLTSKFTLNLFYNNQSNMYHYYGTDVNITYQSFTDVKNEISGSFNFNLEQNYPNPFNPSTTIKFSIPTSGNVTLKVYDLLGKEVATLVNEELAAGVYTTNFNAENLSSGIYFYKLSTANYTASKKMLLIK